jgi:hypothetical protein
MAKTGAVIKRKVVTLEVETQNATNRELRDYYKGVQATNGRKIWFIKQVQVNNIEAKK